MAKKQAPVKIKQFKSDPFDNLKGFAVSVEKDDALEIEAPKAEVAEIYGTFADEMELLGVKKIAESGDLEDVVSTPNVDYSMKKIETDEDIFLAAMDTLSVDFKDNFPQVETTAAVAETRRLKQMKRGKVEPDARLDLHGCVRADVKEKLSNFIKNSQHHSCYTLLVITGKGLNSQGGEPILRNEVESFLNSTEASSVAEWGRAPKQYGGSGALILFLRKQ